MTIDPPTGPSKVEASGDEGCGILGIFFLVVAPISYAAVYVLKLLLEHYG